MTRVRITKSPNFDANLDGVRMKKQIEYNFKTLNDRLFAIGNATISVDTGKSRSSGRKIVKKGMVGAEWGAKDKYGTYYIRYPTFGTRYIKANNFIKDKIMTSYKSYKIIVKKGVVK